MTETEVEPLAVEYPPEKVKMQVAVSDRVVVLGFVHPHSDADTRIGQTAIVRNAHGTRGTEGNYITAEFADGHMAYVNNWVHEWVTLPAPEWGELPSAGQEVTIIRCLCCKSVEGMRGIVTEANDHNVMVKVIVDDKEHEHLVDFTDTMVNQEVNPLWTVEVSPDVNVGDQVYVLRADGNDRYNFTMGTAGGRQMRYSEQRDYLLVTTYNGNTVWVSTWIRASDVPATTPPVPPSASVRVLDVFGQTSKDHIGAVGQVHDRIGSKGVRLLTPSTGAYIRTSQWMIVAAPDTQPISHRPNVPRNTRVRIVDVKSPERKKMRGAIGTTVADVRGDRESCIVEVDGERVLCTKWRPVSPDGQPINPRFVSLMADAEVEALIQEVFDVADRLADKESWCGDYDRIMHDRIGRPQDTIRLTQDYLVEVVINEPDSDPREAEDKNSIFVRKQHIWLLAKGNGGGPNTALVKARLEADERFKGRTTEIYTSWRQ